MRLDYYCKIVVRDNKGATLSCSALKRLDGFIHKTPDSDFTLHMDKEMADSLIGEPIKFVFKDNLLFARASLHEKDKLSSETLAEVTDYVVGQFLDGYGEDELEIRKWRKLYRINFSDEVDGPIKVDAKLPKQKPKKNQPDSALRKFQNAAMEGDIDTVKKYVEAGHHINAIPKQTESFVVTMSALGWASNRNQIDVVKYLIQNGADPNVAGKNAKGEKDGPALFYASPEIAKILLDAGAKVSARNADGLTCLEDISKQLEWHKMHYDPEDFMADYNREEIENLARKLSDMTELFSKYI